METSQDISSIVKDSGGCRPRMQSATQRLITHGAKGNVDEGETDLQCALQRGTATQPMQAEPTRGAPFLLLTIY